MNYVIQPTNPDEIIRIEKQRANRLADLIGAVCNFARHINRTHFDRVDLIDNIEVRALAYWVTPIHEGLELLSKSSQFENPGQSLQNMAQTMIALVKDRDLAQSQLDSINAALEAADKEEFPKIQGDLLRATAEPQRLNTIRIIEQIDHQISALQAEIEASEKRPE